MFGDYLAKKLLNGGEEQATKAIRVQLTPTLDKYMDDDVIYFAFDCYYGFAADGTEVQLGHAGEEQAIEHYLQENGPDQW